MLELRNLTLAYGKQIVLQALDVSIEDREFFSLLGRSGCGKTTLIKAIAGLHPLAGGSILLNGKDTAGLPPEKRNTAVLFQDIRLFPHLSVEDNVAYGLRMQGMPRQERRRKAGEMLEAVGLSGMEKRPVDALSGGQQQRVALARALILRPAILLLDEPFSSLDMDLRRAMRDLLKGLHTNLGLTTLLVTHDIGEAMLLSDRIAILDTERLVCCDTPGALLNKPEAAPYLEAWRKDLEDQQRLL